MLYIHNYSLGDPIYSIGGILYLNMLDPRELLRIIMYFNYLYSFSIASYSTIFVLYSNHVLLVTICLYCALLIMVCASK